MVLAWKGESDNLIYWSQSPDGLTWSPQAQVPGGETGPGQTPVLQHSSDTPALAGFDGIVYFAWKGASDNSIWLTTLNLAVLGGSSLQVFTNEAWGSASITSGNFQTDVGPALGFGDSGNLHLVWKGASDNTIWTSTSSVQGWSPQRKILVVETATRPALASQASAATDILLAWQGASSNALWVGPLDNLKNVQAYAFDIPTFHISMMRTGHFMRKDGSDTDYVCMGVKVRGQPESVVTKFVGDQTGGDVSVGLSVPNVIVSETDNVYFHYSILNSSGGLSAATAFLENIASKLLSALEAADVKAIKDQTFGIVDLSGMTPQEAGALVGGQLGNIVLPGLGADLGALAGWFAGNIESLVFPDCDGPVAIGIFVFSAAQLGNMTHNGGTWVQTDEHPGVTSASGCGQNSDYQVYWNVANVSAGT
jgi:hypothetical protein